jgi:putative transcriptional regulator
MLDISKTIRYPDDVKRAFHHVRRCLMNNRIEAIRKVRGILQVDMAKAMGVSRQTISSLENGRYNPSIMLAYKIAKYFGMTIEEVFVFEEEEI